MTSKSELTDLANAAGLEVCTNNPGDGTRYKVMLPGDEYFAADGLFRSTKRNEVVAFLRGYLVGRTAGKVAQSSTTQASALCSVCDTPLTGEPGMEIVCPVCITSNIIPQSEVPC